MIKKVSALFFAFVITAAFLPAAELILSDNVPQGGVITAVLKGAGDSGAEVLLKRSGRTIAKTESFKVVLEGYTAVIAMLGVPSDASPGIYTVSAGDGENLHIEAVLNVIKRDFISEDIPLTKSMSTLRQSEDIRKAEEWKILYGILTSVDPDAVYMSSDLSLPVTALRQTSFFGDRRRYLYDDGTTATSLHNGIDYSAVPGTPIYSPGPGKVVFSDMRILTGNTVVIEHLPGVYSLYYHMQEINTEAGKILKERELIGTVGATGLVTGAHLHWEIRVAGVAVEPETWLTESLIDKDFIISNIKQ